MKKVKLGEVCDVFSGYAFKSFNEVRKGKPVIKIGNVLSNGKIEIEDCSYTEEIPQNKYLSQKNDIYVALSGATTGKVGLMQKEGFLINQRVGVVRLKNNEVPINYIYSFLQSKTSKILEDAFGAAQPNISPKDILNYEIFIGENAEMQAIADRLDKVSSLIEKRKTQVLKLDQLVKSRFIEMFEGINYLSEPLDNNIVEMFIGPFGSSLKNEVFVDKKNGFCMVYEQKHAIHKTMDVPTRYVLKSKYEELKRFTILGGDIIVSCRGTIGEIFVVPEDAPMGIMHPSIMKIRLNTEKYNQKFFVFVLEKYMDEHSAEAKGSGVKMAVSATVLGQSDFVIPPMDVQNQFVDFVEQADKSKLAIQKSIEKLEILKKSLMQQYFG